MKKKQSSIKHLVQSFAKLVLSWQKDVQLVEVLLNRIHEHQRCMESIHKAAGLIGTKRVPAFEQFPFLEQRLVGRLARDVEGFCNLVNQTMHGLGDVLAAMQMTAHDALQSSLNENVHMFPSDAIFTVDHVLDIQQLQTQFALEYHRKQGLIDKLSSLASPTVSFRSGANIDDGTSTVVLSQTALQACLASFDDNCDQSFLRKREGNRAFG